MKGKGFPLQNRGRPYPVPIRHIIAGNLRFFGSILQRLRINPLFFLNRRFLFRFNAVRFRCRRVPDVLILKQTALTVCFRHFILPHKHTLVGIYHLLGAAFSQLHPLV